jgi:hypothetical protein
VRRGRRRHGQLAQTERGHTVLVDLGKRMPDELPAQALLLGSLGARVSGLMGVDALDGLLVTVTGAARNWSAPSAC